MLFGLMKIGFIKNFILLFGQQIEMLVGVSNGLGLKPVSLLNTIKVNTMIGTVIAGKDLIISQTIQILMVR